MVCNPEYFIGQLRDFTGQIVDYTVTVANFQAAKQILESHSDLLTVEVLSKKSSAAASVCGWLLEVLKYWDCMRPLEGEMTNARNARVTLELKSRKLQEMNIRARSMREDIASLVTSINAA